MYITWKKHKRVEILRGVGIFSLSNVRNHPEVRKIDPSLSLPVRIEPMINLSESKRFMANSGALKFEMKDWKELASKL